MIDLCIIGAGDVVQVRHADILREFSDRLRVRSIVTTRPAAARIVEEKLGYSIARFDNVDDALAVGVDAALVAVPTAQTNNVASYLLRHRLGLYVEKPLAHEVIVGAKFVEEATESGLPIVIGENFRKQERFSKAISICNTCASKPLKALVARDLLRRGARTNPRTDQELFLEHSVHAISAIRTLSQAEVTTIHAASKTTTGSMTEFNINLTLSTGIPAKIIFNVANVWSEDRYVLMYDDADTRVAHNYDFDHRAYNDTIEHYHGLDELTGVETIPQAACGIRSCWLEFIQLATSAKPKPSPSLLSSLHDIQIREAIQLAMAKDIPIPVIPFN